MIEWRSLRARLTFLFVAIFGVTLIGFSSMLYSTFLSNLRLDFDKALFNHTVDVAESVDIGFFGDLRIQSNVLQEGEKLFPFSPGKALIQVLTPEGGVIIRSKQLGNRRLPLSGDELQRLSRGQSSLRTIEFEESSKSGPASYRLITYRINKMGVPPLILQIAMPTVAIEQQRLKLLRLFATAIPLVLLLASLGGLYLSSKALEPVQAMIAKASAMGVDRLSERLPVPGVPDEIQGLAKTFNALLERLELAFRGQEGFIADASHQLKTPLAVLRGEMDLIRQPGRTAEEVQDFLKSASQEIDYLSRMVEDLLILARVEADGGVRAFSRIRLDEILLEVISRLGSFSKACGVELKLDLAQSSEEGVAAPFETEGDPELLQCLFRNLVENALKFSPAGSAVEIRLSDRGTSLRVQVRDRGPGIAPAEIPRLFERFFRSETGKSRTPGFGLGLPIAQKIARFHGSEIRVSSEQGSGSEFSFEMKKN